VVKPKDVNIDIVSLVDADIKIFVYILNVSKKLKNYIPTAHNFYYKIILFI
jgi:hypothetical protein